MKKPLLSIVIPNYNHLHYLKEMLPDLLSQLVEEVELIIIDDASTDESVAWIEGLQDPRLSLLKNGVNRGTNYTANRGLREARGEYFFSLAADDKILPSFFPRMLPLLKKHPGLGLYCSDYTFFYDGREEERLVEPLLPGIKAPYVLFSPEETFELFRKTCFWIPGHTTIFRKEAIVKAGGYDEALRLHSDFFFNHRIALSEPIAYIPEPLCAMRKIATSYSSLCLKDKRIVKECGLQLLEKVLADPLRENFIKAPLFQGQVKELFWTILRRPRYWGFIPPALKKAFRKRVNKIFKKLKTGT